MGILIHRKTPSGRSITYDLSRLTIGDRPCADMSQAELFRSLNALAVPGVDDNTMGKQAMLQLWAEHLAQVAA